MLPINDEGAVAAVPNGSLNPEGAKEKEPKDSDKILEQPLVVVPEERPSAAATLLQQQGAAAAPSASVNPEDSKEKESDDTDKISEPLLADQQESPEEGPSATPIAADIASLNPEPTMEKELNDIDKMDEPLLAVPESPKEGPAETPLVQPQADAEVLSTSVNPEDAKGEDPNDTDSGFIEQLLTVPESPEEPPAETPLVQPQAEETPLVQPEAAAAVPTSSMDIDVAKEEESNDADKIIDMPLDHPESPKKRPAENSPREQQGESQPVKKAKMEEIAKPTPDDQPMETSVAEVELQDESGVMVTGDQLATLQQTVDQLIRERDEVRKEHQETRLKYVETLRERDDLRKKLNDMKYQYDGALSTIGALNNQLAAVKGTTTAGLTKNKKKTGPAKKTAATKKAAAATKKTAATAKKTAATTKRTPRRSKDSTTQVEKKVANESAAAAKAKTPARGRKKQAKSPTKSTAATTTAKTKSPSSTPQMVAEGPPPEALQGGWPEGWIRRVFARRIGDKTDRYWYSPKEGIRFRSMKEVGRFLAALEITNGDEIEAKKKM